MKCSDGHPLAGVDCPRDLKELSALFPDEKTCLSYLEQLRWGEGFRCRFCGAENGVYWSMGDGLRRCAACHSESSVTAGTILAGTRLSLTKWFAAVWYVTSREEGISAASLRRALGLGSYQTAWALLHKLRRAMAHADREPLRGVVEMGEAIMPVSRAKGGLRARDGKALVVIAAQRRKRGPGQVRIYLPDGYSEEELADFVFKNVAPDAEVRSDLFLSYYALGSYYLKRVIAGHPLGEDETELALFEVRRVAAELQRWLALTHRGAVSQDQLDHYLAEFTFRFNRRGPTRRKALFRLLLEAALATDPHPYEAIKTPAEPDRTEPRNRGS